MQNNMPSRLSSLVTGSPPVWVTRRSSWLYFNQVPNHNKNEHAGKRNTWDAAIAEPLGSIFI